MPASLKRFRMPAKCAMGVSTRQLRSASRAACAPFLHLGRVGRAPAEPRVWRRLDLRRPQLAVAEAHRREGA